MKTVNVNSAVIPDLHCGFRSAEIDDHIGTNWGWGVSPDWAGYRHLWSAWQRKVRGQIRAGGCRPQGVSCRGDVGG